MGSIRRQVASPRYWQNIGNSYAFRGNGASPNYPTAAESLILGDNATRE